MCILTSTFDLDVNLDLTDALADDLTAVKCSVIVLCNLHTRERLLSFPAADAAHCSSVLLLCHCSAAQVQLVGLCNHWVRLHSCTLPRLLKLLLGLGLGWRVQTFFVSLSWVSVTWVPWLGYLGYLEQVSTIKTQQSVQIHCLFMYFLPRWGNSGERVELLRNNVKTEGNNWNFPKCQCSWRIQTITLLQIIVSHYSPDETAGPLNPEWHSENQFEILASIPCKSPGLSNTSDTMKWYVGIYCIYSSHVITPLVNSLIYSYVMHRQVKGMVTLNLFIESPLQIHCVRYLRKAHPYSSLVHS